MTAKHLTPEQAIATLPALVERLGALRAEVATDANRVREEWDGLGRVNAQRADHAAALLLTLRPHLARLRDFANVCLEQLDAIAADPFGQGE